MSEKSKDKSPLFQYLDSISHDKTNLMETSLSVNDYIPWTINRGMSLYEDTIMFSNIMNMYPNLSKRMQYDFYRTVIRKRKRYSKWPKIEHSEDFQCVQEYYKYNNDRTIESLSILTSDQINEIKRKLNKGGTL